MVIIKVCSENYEKDDTAIVEREIKKGDVVLDLGANVGHYAIIMAELVGKEGSVFAFEPDPYNFEILKTNVEKYGYDNVILVQKAVCNTNGRTNLYCEGHRTNASLYEKCNLYHEVDTVRLDDYFDNYFGNNNKSGSGIDFIKMDVQGAEVATLQGMSNILQRSKNVKMLIEVYTAGLIKAGVSNDELAEILLKNQFELFHTDGTKVDIVEFFKLGRDSVNLFCVKKMY